MSTLSETLAQLLSKRDMTIAQLARICQIDRSTLHQYINGKRPIKKLSQLETIVEPLCLTMAELSELLEAFDLEQEGPTLYQQRKAVEKFLSGLLTIDEPKAAGRPDEPSAVSIRTLEPQRVVYGELNVKKAVISVLQEANRQDTPVSMMLPPEYNETLADLLLVGQFTALKIKHVICLDGGNSLSRFHNLDALKNVFRCSILLPGYRACYYYGTVEERFGESQLLPNVIVTATVVMQFSADGKEALIHRDPEVVALFRSLMSRLEEVCLPVMEYKSNLFEEINWTREYTDKNRFSHSYEISSGICSIQFWNRELICRYMSPGLPERELLIEMLITHSANLREQKKAGHTTLLMNPVFVEEFIRSGVLREYPSYFFSKPLSKADRKYLLEQMMSACREGWYEIHFIDSGKFPVDFRWEIVAPNETIAFIQHFRENTISIFQLSEPGSIIALYDYMEALGSGRYAMSQEDSEEQVKTWIRKYLDD